MNALVKIDDAVEINRIDTTVFKTAPELKITEPQFMSLVIVLWALENNLLKHIQFSNSDEPIGFNMQDWMCGSVACLGGWGDIVGSQLEGFVSFEESILPNELRRLFFPDSYNWKHEKLADITAEQAAKALRNYLTFGKTDWREVLPSSFREQA